MHKYRIKTAKLLAILIIVFFGVFLLAWYDLKIQERIIDIGIKAAIIDWIAMIFSVLAIIKIILELIRVESHRNFERRLR